MLKKQKTSQKKKKKCKAFFGEEGVFIIEKLTRDITERSKLPKAIELRKILGYNHIDIMVHEVKIAGKIIKPFPHENTVLNKKFNNRKPDIWFKGHNIIIEVDEGNHENFDSDDEKEREKMFNNHYFKFFRCNVNDPELDLFTFLGEINLCISKLREKKQQMK